MKKILPLLVAMLGLFAACKKENAVNTTPAANTPRVTSPEYIDKLLFVSMNNFDITTSQPATFSSTDPNIKITGSGHISTLTSGEIVPIVIKWTDSAYAPTTIYALGATDVDQIQPAATFHGETATDPYDNYVQGWKLLEKLPDPSNTYAMVLRHADASFGRDWTTIHTGVPPANWWTSADSLMARQLNTQGIQRATDLGVIFKQLNLPISRVFTSEFYRSRHTADLIAATPSYTIDPRINHLTHNTYAPGIFYGVLAIINAQPIDNQMTMIVTHHPGNEPLTTGYPTFPTVSAFNWSGSYFIHVGKDSVLTYAGAVTYAMFKYRRDLLLNQ
jgi:phosphohistidine phosphatase SixA